MPTVGAQMALCPGCAGANPKRPAAGSCRRQWLLVDSVVAVSFLASDKSLRGLPGGLDLILPRHLWGVVAHARVIPAKFSEQPQVDGPLDGLRA